MKRLERLRSTEEDSALEPAAGLAGTAGDAGEEDAPDAEEDEDEDEDEPEDDEDDASDDEDEDEDESDEEEDEESEDEEPDTAATSGNPVIRFLRRCSAALSTAARRYPTAAFAVSFLLLSAMATVRYPQETPSLWYLAPSVDVTALLAVFVLCSRLEWRIGRRMRIAFVALLFLVRFIRLGDGIRQRYFSQAFNLYTDLPMVPELVRFVYSGVGPLAFVLVVVAFVLACTFLAITCYVALTHVQFYLRKPRHMVIGAAFVAATYALAFSATKNDFGQKDAPTDEGGFTASATKRLLDEATLLVNVASGRTPFAKQIKATQRRLAEIPTNLAKLQGASVHLILIESYGQTVFEWAPLVQASKAFYDELEAELKQQGFSIVSGSLDSPTYGGQSWLAHSTLATGVRIENQLEYQVMLAKQPKSLSRFFSEAGYRTVLVQPNTTRKWAAGEFYGFDREYFNWDFGYRGPSYAWATMPDQFVLDFVRRHELAHRSKPLFIEYVLISSHAPWSRLPPVVDDWDSLGDGSLFDKLSTIRFNIQWPYFANAQEAYIRSILYDFTLLRHYVSTYVDDDALVIILGDHQPVSDLTGWSPSRGVPVHVLSKNPKLLEPFVALGYVPGMRPAPGSELRGMESFMIDLLAGYSTR